MFNKDHDMWRVVSDSITGIEKDNRYRKAAEPGVELDTTTGIESDTQEINIKYNKDNNAHSIFFETVWALYPVKKGKSKVSDKTKKGLAKLGYDVISKAIENYISTKPSYAEYMYGSTFFNGGYKDYVSEVEDETLNEKPKKREKF